MTERPRVAFFAPVAPYPKPLYGGQIRVDQLLRQLLCEFDVALVCETAVPRDELIADLDYANELVRVVTAPRRAMEESENPEWGTISASARAALRAGVPGALPALHHVVWSDELVSQARRLFDEMQFDAVWACRSWMGEMARAAGARKIHVDVDDMDGRQMLERYAREPFYKRKPLHWLQAAHLDRYERRLPSRFSGVSVCKTDDVAQFAKSLRPVVSVIPNGIDVPRATGRTESTDPVILFVGALWYTPNSEGLQWFAREVFPSILDASPTTKLVVAGRGPLAPELPSILARPGVELHESPESLDELYARATLAIAPLLSGGGTSIKVLESLAYGVPMVASPVAARGLGLEHGVHLSVAASPGEFAARCLDLLADSAAAQALAGAGRAEVLRRFSWDQAGVAARDAMRRVIAP